MRRWKWLSAAAGLLALIPAGSVYYQAGQGESCGRCHEIRPVAETWIASSHRKVTCEECHGGLLTPDAGFHMNNLNRLVRHLRGEIPEQVRLRNADLPRMLERCRGCHRQEFADWQAGPHGIPYSKVFLDEKHNRRQLLMDDCLRCHGAHFEGGIRDLVQPVNTSGPWRFKPGSAANASAIPCLACHQVHRRGEPMRKDLRETHRPSLALYDRRERTSLAVDAIAMPAMKDGARAVRMSPDRRQALCYQCHAPLVTAQVNSGDDRTPAGVHEGLSCLACHQKHGQSARASCAGCHPRLSNCGLDVERMDTSFKEQSSRHNIHFVKCADCHTKGVPKRKPVLGSQLSASNQLAGTRALTADR